MSKIIIAIDGPAASGKSTAAKALAERMGYVYMDTGAMYRTITYLAQRAGIAEDTDAVIDLTNGLDIKLKFVEDMGTFNTLPCSCQNSPHIEPISKF